jgi:hypothetical protein
MIKYRLFIFIGFLFTLSVLMVVVGSLTLAQAGEDQDVMVANGRDNFGALATPVPGGPGFVSLSPAAFKPIDPNYPIAFFGTNIYNPNDNTASYLAPISLPNGATVTKFVAYYVDNITWGELFAMLAAAPFDGANEDQIAMLTSWGDDLSYRYTEIIPNDSPVINQQIYSYYVLIGLPPTIQVKLAGVRVDYAYPSMLPLINK